MNDNGDSMVGCQVDYHYCPDCGFMMDDVDYMSIIADVPCPGRGGKPCGKPISRFHTAYKTANIPQHPTCYAQE